MHPAVFRDILVDLVMFPIWWYSKGLLLMLRASAHTLRGYAQYLAIGVWIKNLFVPMFGQRDWQSRLISIFMRSVQIAGRSLALGVIALGISLAVLAYAIIPLGFMFFTAYHVIGSLTYVS
jgi:hypothetical protein